MAIPTFVAAGAGSGSTGAITPAMPAGTAEDDILLLFLETDNQAITVSGGNQTWTEVTNSPVTVSNGADSTRLTVFWARRGADAPTSPTTSDSGDHQYGFIAAFNGCETSGNPWITNPSTGTDTNDDEQIAISGFTTTVVDSLIVVAVAGTEPHMEGETTCSNSNLASITKRFEGTTSQGNDGALCLFTGTKAAAGAIGTTTVDQVGNENRALAGMVLQLVPPQSTTNVSVYNGATWDLGVVKVYNGSTWDEGVVKVYNGSAWEP